MKLNRLLPKRAHFETLLARLIALALCATMLACTGDDANPSSDAGMGGCLDPLALDCAPSYDPATYDKIYDNVLGPTCGSTATGSQCHGKDGGKAGLFLDQPDKAYDFLMGKADGRARVLPGNPECSILAQRLESTDPAFRMPVGGAPLSPGDRCAIRQWIAQGAKR
jgi:hypothetical protein